MPASGPFSTTTMSACPCSSAWPWNMCLRADGCGHAAPTSRAGSIAPVIACSASIARGVPIACVAALAGTALACAAIAGCGKKSADPADLVPVRLLHSPPVGQLEAQQLRSLSMECERYSPHDGMRGRYDAAYCEE